MKTRSYLLLTVVVISLIGGAAVIYSTANGPVGYSDSAAYFSLARNLISGRGLGLYSPAGEFHAETLHPPLYVLVLSALLSAGFDLAGAARWLNVVFFVLTIFGVGFLFIRYSSSSVIAIPTSILFGIFPVTVMVFNLVMTEPLFFFLFVWSGVCLLEYLRRGQNRWLVASALITGLLPVTRLIGIGVLVSAIVCVFFFSARRWKVRLFRAALYASLASLPIIVWFGWIYLGANRPIAGLESPTNLVNLLADFRAFRAAFMDVVWVWIPFGKYPSGLTYQGRYILLILGAALITLLTAFAEWRGRKSIAPGLRKSNLEIFTFFGLASLSSVVVLAAAYLFTLPTPDVNSRTLLPFYIGAMIGVMGAFAHWQQGLSRRIPWQPILLWLLTLLVVYWNYPQTIKLLSRFHQGEGSIAFRWRNSETMQAVCVLHQSIPIVSNQAATILAWTNRFGYEMIQSLDADFVAGSALYGSDPGDVAQEAFCIRGAALVIFDGFPGQLTGAFGETARGRADTLLQGLVVHERFQDGAIYYCSK